jgi:tetratricopeptide (TPR) repeat protein
MFRFPLRFRSLVLLPLCAAAFLADSQQGGDLQAQILYAFHSEDTNRLASLIQSLSTQIQGGGTGALRYHLAHAEYRFGLLAGGTQPQSAGTAFAQCIDQLKQVLGQDGSSAEALALQSACYSNLAGFKKLEAVLLRSRAADRLAAAHELAPRNPRVAFMTALDEFARAKADSVQNAHAYAQLELATQLFEQSPATDSDVPGWGHADAYLELGRQLQSRGDVLGARNWIEKALIMAPDFKAAQRQLADLGRH